MEIERAILAYLIIHIIGFHVQVSHKLRRLRAAIIRNKEWHQWDSKTPNIDTILLRLEKENWERECRRRGPRT